MSDHMGVIMAVSKSDLGPSQWCFPEDLVKDQDTLTMLRELLDNVGRCDLTACLRWEICKNKIQAWCQKKIKF